uniref:Uncharacterized protein n=1 Tax=Romanomermis culicivorax TaxID=13658 RepID=A0A915JCA2_ROMCU
MMSPMEKNRKMNLRQPRLVEIYNCHLRKEQESYGTKMELLTCLNYKSTILNCQY